MKLKIPKIPPTPFLREALVTEKSDGLWVDPVNVVEYAVDTTLDSLVGWGGVSALNEDVMLEEVVLEEVVVLKKVVVLEEVVVPEEAVVPEDVVVLNEVEIVVSSVSAVTELVSLESVVM
jgi:hypothetical protein